MALPRRGAGTRHAVAKRMFRVSLAVIVGLAFVVPARADSKVDWSQFIEKPGDKPPPVTHAPASEPVAAKPPAKKVAKKPAAKPKKTTAKKKK